MEMVDLNSPAAERMLTRSKALPIELSGEMVIVSVKREVMIRLQIEQIEIVIE